MRSPHFKDLSGEKFCRLTVLYQVNIPNKYGTRFKCLCDCGKNVIVRSTALINENTKSCGCLRREKLTTANYRTRGKGNKSKMLVQVITPEQEKIIVDYAENGKSINYTAKTLKISYNRLETYLKKRPELFEQFRANSPCKTRG